VVLGAVALVAATAVVEGTRDVADAVVVAGVALDAAAGGGVSERLQAASESDPKVMKTEVMMSVRMDPF